MKLKLITTLLMAAGCALGFFVGRFQASSALTSKLDRLEQLAEVEQAQRAAAEYLKQLARPHVDEALSDYIHAKGPLEALRSGDTNEALETLEEQAENNILVVSDYLLFLPAEQRTDEYLARVEGWRDYCASHPRQTMTAKQLSSRFASLLNTNR